MNGFGAPDAGLRDIRGLDAVSAWPLAPGWWVLMLVAMLVVLAVVFRERLPVPALRRSGDWRADARRLLRDLKRRLPGLDGRAAAAEFSELMRRIAMARTARDECAGLSGTAWLDWLSANDPAGFDWREHGRLVVEVPYAPPGVNVDPADMQRLIDAAKVWTMPEAETAPPTAAVPHREAA